MGKTIRLRPAQEHKLERAQAPAIGFDGGPFKGKEILTHGHNRMKTADVTSPGHKKHITPGTFSCCR